MNHKILEKCARGQKVTPEMEEFARKIVDCCIVQCMEVSWDEIDTPLQSNDEFDRGIKTGRKLAPLDCVRNIKKKFGIQDDQNGSNP